MILGYQERCKDRLEMSAQLACWIVNYSGMSGRKTPLRVRDLMQVEGKEQRDGMTKEDIEELAAHHKTKFWTKLKDQYAKKEE